MNRSAAFFVEKTLLPGQTAQRFDVNFVRDELEPVLRPRVVRLGLAHAPPRLGCVLEHDDGVEEVCEANRSVAGSSASGTWVRVSW